MSPEGPHGCRETKRHLRSGTPGIWGRLAQGKKTMAVSRCNTTTNMKQTELSQFLWLSINYRNAAEEPGISQIQPVANGAGGQISPFTRTFAALGDGAIRGRLCHLGI